MKLIDKMVEYFTRLNKKMKRWQRVVSVLSAIVVFVTTYALILPAITLDVDTASTQAGIEVAGENEPDAAGTVFESTEEEEPEVVEDVADTDSSEEAVPEEEVTEASESGSGTTESSEEADTEAPASATEAATEKAADAVISSAADTAESVAADTAAAASTEKAPALITEATQLTYKGKDYIVYADFDGSAQLPVGVELKVKEITKESDPEAYETYYKKALEELKDKYDENTGLSFAKFYDISFVFKGQEVEPKGNVNIKIEYKEAVEIEEQTKVDTIHFNKEDEEKAEIIDSEKEVKDDTKVESVEFESDKFSVYGVIGTETFTEKYLTEDGETYNISVTAGADAHIPADAHLEISEVNKDSEEYKALFEKAQEAVTDGKDASVPFARFFDISIVKDGEKIQPDAPVDVKITFDETVEADKNAKFNAVHITDDGADVIDVETEGEESEKAITVDAVQFSAEGFSIYGVTYTVDFEYTDPATGETYYYSIDGGESINLTDLLVILGIKSEDEVEKFVAEEVTNVKFSDPELVKVTQKGKTLGLFGKADWLLESLQPFDTEETLTISLKNGGEIVVKVTDATYTNLADFVTDASLTIDGHTYGNETWNVRPDVDYELKLSFNEKGSRQFPNGGDEMVMNLPAGLTLKPGTSGTFDIPFGLAGTLPGNQWWVSDDGKLHIKFADDPKDLLGRSNDAHINLSLFAKFDGSTTQFDFNDRVSRDVEYDNSASASVTKSGSYNAETGKMEYVITIKSTGKTSNINVKDTFNNSGLLNLDTSSITIEPNKELNGNIISSATGFDLTIKEMAHDETVTIKYTASVDMTKLGTAGKVEGEAGKNTVNVKPENGPGDEKENIVNQIKFSDTAKSSVSSTDNGDGTVDMVWKIEANKGLKGSLVGAKITDKIDWNSKDIMKYASNPLTLDVVVKDQNGDTVTTLHPTVDVQNPNNQGQETWTYTIPKINNEKEVYSYEITYHTTVTKQENNVTVKNESENEADDKDTASGVVPGTGGGGPSGDDLIVAKTPVKVTEEYVEWNIIVNVPEEGFDELVVTDFLPWHYGDKHPRGDFADTLYEDPVVAGLDADEKMSFTDTEINAQWGNDPYENLYLKRDGQPLGRHMVTMTFTKQNGAANGLNAHARTVTITIKTQNDPLWMAWAAGEGGNNFNEHRNYGKVNNTNIEGKAYPVKSTIRKKLAGNPGEWPKNRIDGITEEGPFYYYDIVLSNVTEEPIIIDDTFDKDVMEFVDLSKYPGAWQNAYYVGAGVNDYDNITTDQNTPTYTISEDGSLHIEASNLLRREDQSFYPYYHIRYYLRVKDMDEIKARAIANGGSYKVGNTAVWNDLPGHYDIDFDFPPLTKEGEFASSDPKERLYNFVIDVNPEGATLNNNEIMELKDTHTDNLSVDYSSVKVYKLDPGVSKDQRTEDMIDSSIVWNFDGNEGVFQIPDKTHYVITYSALIIGSGQQDFSNYAEMNGFHDSKEDSRTFGGDADAGGSILQINLLKYEAGQTSKGLEGTTFQLFKGTGEYDPDTGEEIKEEMKYGDTPYTRGEQFDANYSTGGRNIVGQNITFTTGPDGTSLITLSQKYDGNQLDLNTRYYLKEIDSPPGYKIDSSVEYWEFKLTTDPDEVNYGDDDRRDERGWRQWIYFYYGDILKMANTPTVEPLNVNVDKLWFDKNGDEITDENVKKDLVATVQLMRKTDKGEYVPVKVEGPEDNPTITEVPEGSTEAQVPLNYENDWSYSWNNLPRVEYGGEKDMEIIHQYAYKIEEVNVDGYIVAMTESETETTKTYALKNYKKPEERNTDITVEKEWQDSDGNKIDGTTDKLPEYIDTYIYQVASRTPFTRVPSTGGSIYIINGDPHLLSSDDTRDDYGIYRITKAENWTATFANLPEVVTDSDGNTIYYAYYTKEKPVTGYTTTYTSDGTTRTIVNKEPLPEGEYIDIGLEKKWTDGTSTTPPEGASAKFTVHQQKSTKSGVEGTIQVTITANGETTNSIKCNPGDTLSISVSGEADNLEVQPTNQFLWIAPGDSGTATKEYKVPENFEGTTLNLKAQSGKFAITSITCDGGQIVYSDYEDTGVTKEITLPFGSSWSYTFKNLIQQDEEGNLYRYYITEDSCTPEATEIQFKDKDGNDIKDKTVTDKDQTVPISEKGQKVEVTNKYEILLGSLKITKAVTLNGATTTDSRLNGTYTFGIFTENGTQVKKNEKGEAIPELNITVTDGIADPTALQVDNLKPGKYVIKETASSNSGVSIDSDKEVTVEAGTTISESATAAFTNDYKTTNFSFEKEWRKQDGTAVETVWPEKVKSIIVTVNRKIGSSSGEIVGTYTIKKTETGFDFSEKTPADAPALQQDGTGFKFKLTDLPKNGKIGNTTGEYVYYAVETPVEGYKEATYINPSATGSGGVTTSAEHALDGGKIINRPVEAYELPESGGFGTTPFYTIGLLLIAFAAGLYTYFNKKKLIAIRSDRRSSGTGRGKSRRRGGDGL